MTNDFKVIEPVAYPGVRVLKMIIKKWKFLSREVGFNHPKKFTTQSSTLSEINFDPKIRRGA